jgi:uncharacterized protein
VFETGSSSGRGAWRSRVLPGAGALLLLATFAAGAAGTTSPALAADPPARTVTVTGQGIVIAQPDVVILQLGVSVEAPTVAEARSQAATAAAAVIAAVKADGVADQDVRTVQFNIGPRYDSSPNKPPVLRGYNVNNELQVKIRNLDVTGKVIDDATAAGGDAAVVQNITFSIENTDPLAHQARLAAIADARAKADDYATAAGASVGAALTIIEQGSVPPVPLAAALPANGVASTAQRTPIESGTLQIHAQVSVTYQLQ